MTAQTPDKIAGTGEHVVQFYDSESDLAHAVGRYLARALHAGDASIVIATPAHRAAFAAELATAGVDLGKVERERTIVWLDATELLSRLMPEGRIDADAFRSVVGDIVRELSRSGRAIRAYGEMVDLLWEAGDVLDAIELEKLWNELARELQFSLWCAYHGHSLAVHEHADELHEVCDLHTAVFGDATARFVAGIDAPLAARRFVASVLAQRPFEGRVPVGDAKVVVSELATNAVVHAGTPFKVSVSCDGSAIRIAVRDWSARHPVVRSAPPTALSGRGLHLIDALTDRWGVEEDSDGKSVWAELSLLRQAA